MKWQEFGRKWSWLNRGTLLQVLTNTTRYLNHDNCFNLRSNRVTLTCKTMIYRCYKLLVDHVDATKAQWGVYVQLHSVLASAMDEGEWAASLPGRFTPQNTLPQ